MRTTRLWVALLVIAAVGDPATGGVVSASTDLTDLSLEELLDVEIPVVVAASHFEQQTLDAPSSVSIVGAEEIRRYGWRTIGEILNSLPGFYLSSDRIYTFVGVRGFSRPGDYNTRILLLVDGHRMNDSVYDQALVGEEGILDAESIERVEVVRGPGSSIYGTNAFFAVVNVVTKRGADLRGGEAAIEARSFGTARGRVAWGTSRPDGWDAIASVSGLDGDGQDLYFPEYDDPTTHSGVAEDCDRERWHRAFFRVAKGEIALEGALSSRDKGLPTGAYGTLFDDPRNRFLDEREFLDLSWRKAIGSASSFEGRVFHDWYRYYGTFVYSGEDGAPESVNQDETHAYFRGVEATWSSRLVESHHLTAGVEYRDQYRVDQRNYDSGVEPPYLDSRESGQIAAVYAQDEFAPSPRILLNFGLRYDHYDTFGGTTNPRLAFLFKPRPNAALKLLAGKAFRAPNAYESYYAESPEYLNPDLRPETVLTFEAAYESYLRDGVRVSASAFRFDTEDLITLEATTLQDVQVFRNLESVRSNGIEIEAEKIWSGGARARGSYSLTRTIDTTAGSVLDNSPRYLVKLLASAPAFGGRWTGAAEAHYESNRPTLSGGRTGSFLVADVTVTGRPHDRLELALGVRNALDRRYACPGMTYHIQDTLLQDGRSFWLRATARF